jgi:hypothetical protein
MVLGGIPLHNSHLAKKVGVPITALDFKMIWIVQERVRERESVTLVLDHHLSPGIKNKRLVYFLLDQTRCIPSH